MYNTLFRVLLRIEKIRIWNDQKLKYVNPAYFYGNLPEKKIQYSGVRHRVNINFWIQLFGETFGLTGILKTHIRQYWIWVVNKLIIVAKWCRGKCDFIVVMGKAAMSCTPFADTQFTIIDLYFWGGKKNDIFSISLSVNFSLYSKAFLNSQFKEIK